VRPRRQAHARHRTPTITMTEPTQPNAAQQNAVAELDDNQIIAERREKLRALREQGVAFPNDFRPTHHAADLQTDYADADKDALEAKALQVALAGRMMLKRVMGKASFATVRDGSGQIQFFVTPADVGEATYEAFKKWDLGDIVAAKGLLFRTNKGELSVRCTELRLLSKALRPLPDKFHGLADQEMRYRQRYVDLIVTDEARKTFVARTKVVDPQVHGRCGLHGSRNADAASDSRRRGGQAVRHAPQRARHADVPADRAGAVSEAAGGRRLRARIRDQPEFP
jgi:lysyl-tRNA synthetase class 2